MGRAGRHLSFANVASGLALFVALATGGAYAATELDKNEVKSKHIGKGQVKNADLADNSVTSPKVADGSLLNQDFAPGQLPQGPRGPQGETGAQGERGLQGVQGEPGTARAYGLVKTNCAATCPVERSKGIVSVTRPQTGAYCIEAAGVDGRQIAAVTTPDYFSNPDADRVSAMAYNTSNAVGVGCPRLSDVVVVTHKGSSVSVRDAANTGSTSVADDSAQSSNSVSFNVVIP